MLPMTRSSPNPDSPRLPRFIRDGELKPCAGRMERAAGHGGVVRPRSSWAGLAVSLGVHVVVLSAAAWLTWGGSGDEGLAVEASKEAGFDEVPVQMRSVLPPQKVADRTRQMPAALTPASMLPTAMLALPRRLAVEHEAAIMLPEILDVPGGMELPQELASEASAAMQAKASAAKAERASKPSKSGRAAGAGGGSSAGRAMLAGKPAALVSAPPPAYPANARRARAEGTATLLVSLSATGAVLGCEVSRSAGRDDLDEAALRAVKKWRFSPAVRDGESIQANVLVKVVFRLT